GRVHDEIARRDPVGPYHSMLFAVIAWFDGHFARGIEPMRHVLAIGGDALLYRWMLGYNHALNGSLREAEDLARSITRDAPDNPYARQIVSLLAGLAGDRRGALEAIAPVHGMRLDHHMLFHVAECYAVAGETARAVELIGRSVSQGFHPYDFIAR